MSIETDLLDFHKMIFTVMKVTFKKLKQKIINYRDYQNFANNHFRNHIINELSVETIKRGNKGLEIFLQMFKCSGQICT